MQDSFLALPRGRHAEAAFLLVVSFVLVFLVFYGGASYLSGFVPYRLRVDLPFDSIVPFVPEASLIYISITPLVGIAPFVLRRFRELWPLFVVLCVETLIGAVFFIALPIDTGFPTRDATGPMTGLFHLADSLNLERNGLPSLHVAYALSTIMAYNAKATRAIRCLLWAWLVTLMASTILIHEHHVADIIAGFLLGGLTSLTVGHWASNPGRIANVATELRCLREMAVFSFRHIRYLVIALALYRASLGAFKRRRIIRTGFCFLQVVDDLLDGDRHSDEEPLVLVDRIVDELEKGQFGAEPLSRLAFEFCADAKGFGDGSVSLTEIAIRLIRVMQHDRQRVVDKCLLDEEQLRAHHRLTFKLSLDLMLIAGESKIRADDVPSLIDALIWCSTRRDLGEDLGKGLVNIPKEVIESAFPQGIENLSFAALTSMPAIREWMNHELGRASDLLDCADEEIDRLGNANGTKTLRMFADSIRRYVRRYGHPSRDRLPEFDNLSR